MPCGSSGIWTGDRRLFSKFFVSRKVLDTASTDDAAPLICVGELSDLLEMRAGRGGRCMAFGGP